MNTTVRIKQSEVYKDWHVIDAAGRPLGRVATEAASLLKGKHKPTYEPHLDDGDFVIVVNAAQVRVSGNKDAQMMYYRHSGYPGGLKSRTYSEQMEKFPERILEQAIWGMLPKGPLGKKMFRHLKVYKFANHPHSSQINATAKAQDARKASQAALAETPLRAKRLRPLSVPQVQEEEAPKAAKVKAAPSPAAEAARKARERVRGEAPAEAEVAPVAAEVSPMEAPAAEAPATEAPKRSSRRKAAEADAPASESAEATEAAPKRAPRRRAAAAEASAEGDPAAEEAPKPARRRAAAKSPETQE